MKINKDMKKTLATALAVLVATSLFAQGSEDILKKIETAPHNTVSLKFKEVRTPATGAAGSVTVEGELLFKPEGYLSMLYTNKEVFIIDGSKMTINRDNKSNIFDTNKNVMMRGLSHVLLNSFSGTPSKFAEEQDADITATKEGGDYVVTVTARKKAARGYSKVIIRYDASDCSIREMQMDEVTGASTFYSVK